MKRQRFIDRIAQRSPIETEAAAVQDASAAGMVDGVHVDFRHDDLPPGEWRASLEWHKFSHRWAFCGIIFPFQGGPSFDELCGDSTLRPVMDQPIYAHAGDSIYVERVETEERPGLDFDHPHERLSKRVFLVLKRPDGSEERPASPTYFYGSTMFRRGPDPEAWDRLADRIAAQGEGIEPETIQRNSQTKDYRSDALGYLLDADQEIEVFLDLLQTAFQSTSPAPQGMMFSGSAATSTANEHARQLSALALNFANNQLLRLVSHVARAAFFQARFEMQGAEQRVVGQNKGLAARSRDKTPDNRLDLAREYWVRYPKATLTNVARAVAVSTDLNSDDAISEKNIRDSIKAEHRRAGIIPQTSPSFFYVSRDGG